MCCLLKAKLMYITKTKLLETTRRYSLPRGLTSKPKPPKFGFSPKRPYNRVLVHGKQAVQYWKIGNISVRWYLLLYPFKNQHIQFVQENNHFFGWKLCCFVGFWIKFGSRKLFLDKHWLQTFFSSSIQCLNASQARKGTRNQLNLER